jgi:uncharacterized protein (DUF2062 family)
MRKRLRKHLPDHRAIRENRWLGPFAAPLLHPRLWHLNRHSAAGAVAVGLFCGLIPGPFQMLGAALGAAVLRLNLPLALLTTLYSNPITIVPLYLVAFEMGRVSLRLAGQGAGDGFVAPPAYGASGLLQWLHNLLDWTAHLGKPLALGLVLLATTLAFVGYLVVRVGWRCYLLYAWRRRSRRRTAPEESAS